MFCGRSRDTPGALHKRLHQTCIDPTTTGAPPLTTDSDATAQAEAHSFYCLYFVMWISGLRCYCCPPGSSTLVQNVHVPGLSNVLFRLGQAFPFLCWLNYGQASPMNGLGKIIMVFFIDAILHASMWPLSYHESNLFKVRTSQSLNSIFSRQKASETS